MVAKGNQDNCISNTILNGSIKRSLRFINLFISFNRLLYHFTLIIFFISLLDIIWFVQSVWKNDYADSLMPWFSWIINKWSCTFSFRLTAAFSQTQFKWVLLTAWRWPYLYATIYEIINSSHATGTTLNDHIVTVGIDIDDNIHPSKAVITVEYILDEDHLLMVYLFFPCFSANNGLLFIKM